MTGIVQECLNTHSVNKVKSRLIILDRYTIIFSLKKTLLIFQNIQELLKTSLKNSYYMLKELLLTGQTIFQMQWKNGMND